MTIDTAMLTKAVLRAAAHLDLSDALPSILGIPSSDVISLQQGGRLLDPTTAEWQSATLFVSLFRSLITLLGDADRAKKWLADSHQTLGTAPTQLLRTPGGLERVIKYLDAVQKFEHKLPPRSY